MIELYNGTVEVQSTPDVGSKFTVRLPLWKLQLQPFFYSLRFAVLFLQKKS
jgi:hypothetical protein